MKLVARDHHLVPSPRGEPPTRPQATLTVTVEHPGNTVVLIVAGEMDMLTAPQVHRAVNHVLFDHPRLLVVDLSKVGFLDCAGLTVLVAAQQQAGRRTRVRMVANNQATLRPLDVTGMHETLAIYASREDALTEQVGPVGVVGS